MSVEEILPFSHFTDLFLAVLVLFIVAWSARIVDVIPILSRLSRILVLLAFLSTSPLAFLGIKIVHVFVVGRGSCPICKGGFRRRRCRNWVF